MPTNADTFNSRVTSEALEKKFRDTFPAQGGAELIQDLFAQGVIVPIVDFTSAAEGSSLPEFLQTAWDFASGNAQQVGAGTTTAITNTGFWKLGVQYAYSGLGASAAQVLISDGLGTKQILKFDAHDNTEDFYVKESYAFLRSGDSLQLTCGAGALLMLTYRQVADVSGNLVNPLGFTF